MKKLSPEFVSALQEFLRTFVLGMVTPLGAALLIIKSGINVEVGGFNINWLLAGSILLSGSIGTFHTSLLSAIDKYVHKVGISTPMDFKSFDKLK